MQVTHILLHWVGQHFADFDTGDERMQQFLDTFEEYFKEEVRLCAHYNWHCSHSQCVVTEDMLLCIHIIHMQSCVRMQNARFIFRVFRNLTKFVKVYPANLLISQYKRIIPARKS